MDSEKICETVINELQLVRNERMAVIYFATIGDFFSLCSTVEKATGYLGKDFILLYCSEIHEEILGWFEYDDHKINSYKISEELYSDIRSLDLETRIKYQEYFVFWDRGCTEFRNLTRNVSEDFSKSLTAPRFPPTDIEQKYKEYIVPYKTVLIIPEAHTIQTFPIWFWNLTAYLFEVLGYSVVFNVPPQRERLYNGKSLLVPISDIVGFVNTGGLVFGVRCGLFDVLSASTAKMVIFSTDFYKTLDRVFNIDNSDGRIRTVYYCDDDPFFNKTEPVSFVQKAFDREFQSIRELLHKLCENDIPPFAEEYPADISKAYACATIFNKYRVGRPGTDIEPFGGVMYSLDAVCGKLVFSIRNLSVSGYRFDYRIFCNDKPLIVLTDVRSSCVSYPLEQSGEYYVEAIITDLNNYHQEIFTTHRMAYTLPPTETACGVSPAALLEYTCGAVKSLEKTNAELKKQIEEMKPTLDAVNALHIKNGELAAQNLALSDERSKLESKLLQAERLAKEQSESFGKQRCKLLSELDELRNEISRLNTSAEKSANEQKELRAENKALEERAALFENSRSWRITKPLRSIGAFFRKVRKGFTDNTNDRVG